METSSLKPGKFERIWNLLGVIGLGGTASALCSGWFWFADLASQLGMQYFLLCIIATPLWLYRRKHKTLVLATAAIGFHLWLIVPYLVSPEVPDGAPQRTWRLTIFNVLRTNREIDETIVEAMATDPDFLYLMEVSDDWHQPLTELKETYPYQKLLCRTDHTGVAFLSKHKWKTLTVVDAPGANLPLAASFEIDQSRYQLLLTHPLPPLRPDLTLDRDKQLTELAARSSADMPTLIAGDLNQTLWSSRFHNLLAMHGLKDGSIGFGLSPTLAPLSTWFGGAKVDHVLINRHVCIRDFTLGATKYSDHRPVTVDFCVKH